jgi:hypothetical protein
VTHINKEESQNIYIGHSNSCDSVTRDPCDPNKARYSTESKPVKIAPLQVGDRVAVATGGLAGKTGKIAYIYESGLATLTNTVFPVDPVVKLVDLVLR